MVEEPNKMQVMAEEMRKAQANINPEDEAKIKDDPGYQTYKHIYDSTVRLFDDEQTQQLYAKLAGQMGKELAVDLMSFMVVAMTNSAYEAVAHYNNIMIDQINEQFTEAIEHINNLNSDIDGMKSAITVLRKRIEDIMMKGVSEEARKTTGVS